MQNGVGAAAHRHIEHKGVIHGIMRDDFARFRPVGQRHFNRTFCGGFPKFETRRFGGKQRSVSGQCHTDRFAQAIHRIGRKHTGAGARARTGFTLQLIQLGFGHLTSLALRNTFKNADQINNASVFQPSGRHRAAAGEYCRNIATNRAHQHAGNNLVAVRNTDHRIKSVRLNHGFHAVGNQLAAGQRKLHSFVAHRDAIADTDYIKFTRRSACFADGVTNDTANLIQMNMAGNHFVERITDRNERFFDIRIGQAGGMHQTAVGGTFHSFFNSVTVHHELLYLKTIDFVAYSGSLSDSKLKS